MKTLYELDNIYTDKGNSHTYFDSYMKIFNDRRNAENVLEVGVREGGSLKLWLEYFPEAFVHGVELSAHYVLWNLLDQFSGRYVINFADAYTKRTVESYGDQKFDIIIDDGSHVVEHQIFFIQNYFDLLKDDGVMIIEDIQNFDHCEFFYYYVPEEYRGCVSIYDLRHENNGYDNVLFVIDKSFKGGRNDVFIPMLHNIVELEYYRSERNIKKK